VHAFPRSKKPGAPSDGLESGSIVVINDVAQLRHKVINDYQALIACIFQESVRSPNAEVRETLSRVADCVHELACSLRDLGPNYREHSGPTFDFGPSQTP
jgi:hypothetical protein